VKVYLESGNTLSEVVQYKFEASSTNGKTARMEIKVARAELDSITGFQQEMHVPELGEDTMSSEYYRETRKSTYHSTVLAKLAHSTVGADDSSGTETAIYTANNNFHLLCSSYMRVSLPSVKVKTDYRESVRIAWTHNIGSNIVLRGTFRESGDQMQQWDSVFADIYGQYFSGGLGKKDSHNAGTGNISALEEWTWYLPPYPINVEQPWFYNFDNALPFPIHYKQGTAIIHHECILQRSINKLLRVQIKVGDQWCDVAGDEIDTYIDCSLPRIAIPELWAKYGLSTPKEIAFYHHCAKQRHYYIRDVVILDDENTTKYETRRSVSLKSANPCVTVFWMAQNETAALYNNRSNYTTNTESVYAGWDPVKHTSLTYDTIRRFEEMPSDHFNIAQSRHTFKSAPSEAGYHAMAYATDPTDPDGGVGVTFSDKMVAKLSCLISDGDIYRSINRSLLDAEPRTGDHISGDPSPGFIVRVRLLILRKLTITKISNATNGTSGPVFKFSIV
jgi:hypothetical protein